MDGAAKQRTLSSLLAAAKLRIERHSPAAAFEAMKEGAILIDIRSSDDRRRDGIVPGSVHIPRTVLEWRVAHDSTWRNPHVGGLEEQIILLCDHGYSTILAAATLVDLGFTRVGRCRGGASKRGGPTGSRPASHPSDVVARTSSSG